MRRPAVPAPICENLEYFGGGPNRGEPDPRAVWDESEALAGLDNVLDIIVDEIAPDGTQFADERESLLWGFCVAVTAAAANGCRTLPASRFLNGCLVRSPPAPRFVTVGVGETTWNALGDAARSSRSLAATAPNRRNGAGLGLIGVLPTFGLSHCPRQARLSHPTHL